MQSLSEMISLGSLAPALPTIDPQNPQSGPPREAAASRTYSCTFRGDVFRGSRYSHNTQLYIFHEPIGSPHLTVVDQA